MKISPYKIKNPRILDIREQTLMYQFKAISVPSNTNGGANGMSRIPAPITKVAATESDGLEEAMQAGIESQCNQESSPIKMARIREAKVDYQYLSFVETIEKGFPEYKEHLPVHIREFWNMQNNLCTVQSLVFKEGCVLIPRKLCCELLDQLHIGHQEVNSMRSNTRQRFFWPGMAT